MHDILHSKDDTEITVGQLYELFSPADDTQREGVHTETEVSSPYFYDYD